MFKANGSIPTHGLNPSARLKIVRNTRGSRRPATWQQWHDTISIARSAQTAPKSPKTLPDALGERKEQDMRGRGLVLVHLHTGMMTVALWLWC